MINKAHPLSFQKGDILLHGHTHIPACEDCGDFTYLNPGSVSIPKNGSAHSYMIYENGAFVWKELLTGEEYQRFRCKPERCGRPRAAKWRKTPCGKREF